MLTASRPFYRRLRLAPRHWQLSRFLSQHERVPALRQAMAADHALDLLVVPSEDAHQSEYTAECDNRRAWVSGFTGSAGCAVITASDALLFTDGRYFLQANEQLDACQWTLMKQGQPGVPTWQEYVKSAENKRIGIDASVITADQYNQLQQSLKKGSSLVLMNENLVDKVRGSERPARPTFPVKPHALSYAGKTHQDKLQELRADLASRGVDATVVSCLDEIAWLLNLRGADIHCCPVFFAYCVVTRDDAFLYVQDDGHHGRWAPLHAHLHDAGVQIKSYDAFLDDLGGLAKHNHSWLVDPTFTNMSIVKALGSKIKFDASMIPRAKAIKNAAELASSRACHVRDGAAVTRHFAWLARALQGGERLHEHEAAEHLASMRQEDPLYVGLSFDTIAATGGNGAIIHYQPSPTDSALIDARNVYLCDSGAQYLDGTTDITRTFLFAGDPAPFQKRAFTRVLQCHIALDQAVFPKGTSGYQLDAIARAPLWRDGLNYRHGTGHGVGAYLNVHEGPIGISSRLAHSGMALEENMLVTNEPGYYEDGDFGIRIENVLCVKKAATAYEFDTSYLGFDHLTFVPLGQRLMATELLQPHEVQWINTYHEQCREWLEPLLKSDRRALQWLEEETRQIDKNE
ncbi:peptidase M24, structural domain-containing protein [Gongronella butleri]|nr:peptidase M24, structural domain-containing protein [Gongronella butleri]